MFGKTWVFGSLFAAITLVTTAAAPAQAEDGRWGLGRPQWQPPTHAGWFDNHGQDRRQDWRGNNEGGRERDGWGRRDHDGRWDDRRDDRWSHREPDRQRDHDWWHRPHRGWD